MEEGKVVPTVTDNSIPATTTMSQALLTAASVMTQAERRKRRQKGKFSEKTKVSTSTSRR